MGTILNLSPKGLTDLCLPIYNKYIEQQQKLKRHKLFWASKPVTGM